MLLAGCQWDEAPPEMAPPTRQMGLMTSLPLFWPLGAGIADIAGGTAPAPWQRAVFEGNYRLVPLDTLSLVAGLGPGAQDSDPLAGLARLAIIQPRGLSPADNAALDDWVRGGGRLLMVLDPQLTGEYDLPLGDPRRPSDTALIPPVAARWGMAISFDEGQPAVMRHAGLGEARIPLALAGQITLDAAAGQRCMLVLGGAGARCRVGKGRVTLIADAAAFEHRPATGTADAAIRPLLEFAFEHG